MIQFFLETYYDFNKDEFESILNKKIDYLKNYNITDEEKNQIINMIEKYFKDNNLLDYFSKFDGNKIIIIKIDKELYKSCLREVDDSDRKNFRKFFMENYDKFK